MCFKLLWQKEEGAYAGEWAVAVVEALQSNGKFDVARTHNILDLEILKHCWELELLDDLCILYRTKSTEWFHHQPFPFKQRLVLRACTI